MCLIFDLTSWILAGVRLHKYLLVLKPAFLIHHNKESGVIFCFELNKGERQATKNRSCVCPVKNFEGDIGHSQPTSFILSLVFEIPYPIGVIW